MLPSANSIMGTPLRLVPPLAPSPSFTDDDCMRLLRSGQPSAIETLVDRYGGALLGYLARMLGDRARGEEIAQEVWLSVWINREKYTVGSSFRAWLFTLAGNRARNEKRDRFRRTRVFSPDTGEDYAKDSTSQLEKIVRREKLEELSAAIETLPADQKEAVLLRYSAGLEYPDIAKIVGAGESTVRSRIFHGLSKLRGKVGGEWFV